MDGVARFWCYNCEHVIDPIRIGNEMFQCPLCQGGFVEDIASSSTALVEQESDPFSDFLGPTPAGGGSESERALALWAPILLGMMSNPRRRRRLRRRLEMEEEENNNGQLEIESMDQRRRRRSSATILQLLQGLRAGMLSESMEEINRRRENNSILINSLDHPENNTNPNHHHHHHHHHLNRVGSLGDYFVGPGLDLLLQHLAENDPNPYGTPPAQKEVVETMPMVKINDNLLQCSICLDDFEIGNEAKEMPCKHKFHSGCIVPWLELHSSCPVCRYQLPFDEPKLNNGTADNINGDDNRRHLSMPLPLPWPLSSLFSSPGMTPSSSSSGNPGSDNNEN